MKWFSFIWNKVAEGCCFTLKNKLEKTSPLPEETVELIVGFGIISGLERQQHVSRFVALKNQRRRELLYSVPNCPSNYGKNF